MRDIKKLLGKKIREFRKSKRMTQEQLAESIGIGTANISYFETGRFAPSMETLDKLSEVLGVMPYEFYMFEHIKSCDELRKELFEALDNDEELLRLIYKFYKTVR